MGTHNILTCKQWIECRTRFELGDKVRVIARDYQISEGTIRARAKKENWMPILKEKIQKFSEVIRLINEQNAGLIAQQIQGIAESVTFSRLPTVQERLQQEVALIGDFSSFIRKAANMNVKYLNELDSNPELDLKSKLAGLNVLKATMRDISDIKRMPELPLENGESEQTKALEIVFVKKLKDDLNTESSN